MNDKYWEEEIETMPREKLRELQLQRLKRQSILLQILPIISRCFKIRHYGRQYPVSR